MTEEAATPKSPGRILVYVAIAAVSSLVAFLPGLDRDDGSTTVVARQGDEQQSSPSTTTPKSTAAPTTAAVPAAPILPVVSPTPALPAASRNAVAAVGGVTRTFDPGPLPVSPVVTPPPTAPFVFPPGPPPPPPPPLRPVEAPTTGAYLGAYVNEFDLNGGGSIEQVLGDLPGFSQVMGRNLAIVSVYQPWASQWVHNENLAKIDEYGAIPMVSWHCGDTNERVANGDDDALIFDFAYQLKAYGGPVLLRWFWEPNLLAESECLGEGPPSAQGARYQAAFQRVAAIFDAAGATNVAFVWCSSTADVAAPMQNFYPGDDAVDWIAADGYDREELGAGAFTKRFHKWYDLYKNSGKPLMVAETGARTAQPEFLQDIADVVPRDFPAIKAIVYFDAFVDEDWRLGSFGGVGLPAFAALGRDPYFAPMPP
jgi:hypothetical protein